MSRPRITRSEILGAFLAGVVVVGFCLVLLRHDPLLFWNDDYELSVLPVFADVARSWNEGHLPLLSPYSWVCGNLAGEFQYGTFSIFVNAAVVLIWKFPLTFPQQAAALSIAHLFVLAAGAFPLARQRSLSIPLSIFVALIAALNGWIIGWGAIDWFGALGAFAWLPWAWWALEKSVAAAAHLPPGALPALILPSWTVKWADFSTRYLSHTATELACGLVAPAALVAGFVSYGRSFVRQIKWELLLLLLVLLLSMVPTAGVFRWSFRWLPLFHFMLAL